jgi:hypothetical protein
MVSKEPDGGQTYHMTLKWMWNFPRELPLQSFRQNLRATQLDIGRHIENPLNLSIYTKP